jgi:hypothetical protein
VVAPAALSVYLSPALEEHWIVLQEVGEIFGGELIIYDVGTALESYSGIFRVGEIAAWHAATVAIFLIILASRDHSLGLRIGMGVLVVGLIGAILLTGRRKMLMTLTIFVVTQWALLTIFRRGGSRVVVTLLILGIFGSLGLALLDPSSDKGLYLQRGISVFDDAIERLLTAINLFSPAIPRSYGIGLGAGVTAQGSQHVGGVGVSAGGVGEAGIGKIVIELGLLGMIAVVVLIVRLSVRLFTNLKFLSQTSERLLYYSVSFIAFIVANLATFTVATQVYGDYFVLTIIGLVAGILFSVTLVAVRLRSASLENTPPAQARSYA